ncbi:MAG: DUF2141 domain-containing protein [Synechococcales bacterium]|nr:DUF2141 domain-containing protein [Synechococcales bacterium]
MKQWTVQVLLLGLFGAIAPLPNAQAVPDSQLEISINGLRNQSGQVCFSLFSQSQGFPSGGQALQADCVDVGEDSPSILFRGLNPGSYAVAVFHDVNRDGQLNQTVFGIPTEGFGFSRNPRLMAGPPSFGDAAFVVAGVQNSIQIQLRYLR